MKELQSQVGTFVSTTGTIIDKSAAPKILSTIFESQVQNLLEQDKDHQEKVRKGDSKAENGKQLKIRLGSDQQMPCHNPSRSEIQNKESNKKAKFNENFQNLIRGDETNNALHANAF